jgi:Flp pilus assembly protein TadG
VIQWKRGLNLVLAFFGGAAAGWLMAMGLYVALSSAGLMFDREGGKAMAFAFVIGPFAGLICGIIAAIWDGRRA